MAGQTVEIKLCFFDGIVWMPGQTVEIKLRFQVCPTYFGRCLRETKYAAQYWLYCSFQSLMKSKERHYFRSQIVLKKSKSRHLFCLIPLEFISSSNLANNIYV